MSSIQRLSTPHSYSAAVLAGDYVFLGLHRGFGEAFAEQLEGALAQLKESLAHFDLPLESLVKVNVWLKNIHDLPEMEQAFRRYFPEAGYPARMTATTEFIDTDCLLMIDGIAYTRA